MRLIGERVQAFRDKLVVPEHEEPVFKCVTCQDSGYTSRDYHNKRTGAVNGVVAWFCSCERGTLAEAGHWFDRINPMIGPGKRGSSAGAIEEFQRYCRANPQRAPFMQPAIERLQEEWEKSKSRKVGRVSDSMGYGY